MKFLNKVPFFVISLTLNVFASTPTSQYNVSQYPREIRNIIEAVLNNEKVKTALSDIVTAQDPQSDALAEQFRNVFKKALVSAMDKNESTLDVSDKVYYGEFDNEIWNMAKSIKDGFIENYQANDKDFDKALRKTFNESVSAADNQSVSAADFILKNSSTGSVFDKLSEFFDLLRSSFNKAFSKSLIKDDVKTIYNDEELKQLSEGLEKKLDLVRKLREEGYDLNDASVLSAFEKDIDNFTSKFKSVLRKDQAIFEKAFSDPDFAANFAKAVLEDRVDQLDYRARIDFIRDYVTKAVTKTLLKEEYGITDSNTDIEGYIKSLQSDPSAGPTLRNSFKDALLELKSEIKPSELDKLSRAQLDKLGITDADAYIYKEPNGDVFIGFRAKFFDEGLKVYNVTNGQLIREPDDSYIIRTMTEDLEGSLKSTHYIGTSYYSTFLSNRDNRGMDYSYHLNLDDDVPVVRPVEGI